MKMKKDTLIQKGLSSQLFRSQQAIEKLKLWLVNPGKSTKVMISTLHLDDQLIAGEFGVIQGNYYTSYMGAMDQAYTRLSPGAYQLEQTIDWACKNGIETIDLLPPADNYKNSLANNHYDVVEIFLPLSFKGQLMAKWRKNILPSIKFIYGKLPKQVQQILASAQVK